MTFLACGPTPTSLEARPTKCETPTGPLRPGSAVNDVTAEERAAKREAAIQGMVDKGHTRERAEELIDMIAAALFAPGKRFGSP